MIFVFILSILYARIYEQSWERVHMVLNASRFEDVWDKVLSRFERETDDKIIYNTYFLGSKIIGINEGVVTVVAPSRFACQMLNNRFFDKIVNYLRDITQTNFDCQIIDPESAENFSNLQLDNNMSQSEKVFVSNLNPRFTFENFVVGHSNRECYTAALSTALDPGNFYNPLFMYGKSGLGKTHLLHAIGNFIKNKNNLTKVLYLTADDFFEDYIKTVKKEGTENLKDKYRGIDVLLLDDIQFLRAKNATQETFFNIFNLLVNSGKQIVITADKPPQELEKIETRLVGRFSSGLSVEIQALEFETALAILKKKVEAQDINRGLIDDDVLKYIAQNYSTDVRQLEGA
ncbi:MAG: DnaA/Hda family protein, partial [Erysipelotrichales bacterium]|nr:DnaA/Hda family protein [Erysipelotrichales bacterium]